MAKPYRKNERWYVRYRDATGRWRDKATDARTKAEAKLLCHELERREGRIREGLDAPPPLDGGGTLGELLRWWIDEYLAHSPSFERSVGTVRRHLLSSELARLRLVDVTPGRIETFLVHKSREVGPQTVNHLRGYLSRAFSAARRTERFSRPNPVASVSRRKVPRRVPDYLRPAEAERILRFLPAKWTCLFAAGLYTGLRKGELFGLRKSDLDLDRGLLTVERSYDRDTTKGGHADVIPIARALVPYLEAAIDASPSALVFPAANGEMHREGVQLEIVLRRALRRAGIVTGYRHVCRRKGCGHVEQAPDDQLRRCPRCQMKLWPVGEVRPLRFHHLRHTTASLLMMAGANPAAVQRIMRHSDPRITTEVYGHLAPEYLRAEVDRLAFSTPPPRAMPTRKPTPFAAGLLLAPGAEPEGAPEDRPDPSDSSSVSRSGWRDLNPRHPAPKAGALPGCATPRVGSF